MNPYPKYKVGELYDFDGVESDRGILIKITSVTPRIDKMGCYDAVEYDVVAAKGIYQPFPGGIFYTNLTDYYDFKKVELQDLPLYMGGWVSKEFEEMLKGERHEESKLLVQSRGDI